mmetsp:Transcript_36408/g.145457  ORF Transcript_36408/g.145457 Transcript_36408/m.145457 type:complete len:99 (-) Transcript_36408:1149-1445(-)
MMVRGQENPEPGIVISHSSYALNRASSIRAHRDGCDGQKSEKRTTQCQRMEVTDLSLPSPLDPSSYRSSDRKARSGGAVNPPRMSISGFLRIRELLRI